MNLTKSSDLYGKDEIINILKSVQSIELFKKQNINAIILFGSIVTVNFQEYSDVDIAILSKKKNTLNDIMDLEETLRNMLNREIDIIDLNNEELDLRFKVSVYDTGMLIYNDELDLYTKDYNKTDIIYRNNEEFRFFRERDVIYDE
ncbi:type VII toxin-antitoxin system MntA family adenylyltransferase antitoxin [uncultured Clostridium sp.]|uniref:type VII toxin-antitoxin system MntA family adenylyltransferase antitoxin n=1 Tax=uncultured Clostridium sp. TaxID=59620 RepID=UPI0028EE0CD7|nr:nucleotidyltransferase domain-containing protein [uncultured Clostridium sp.]